MQLQFNQSVIPCLKSLKREMQTQEQTQEVRITDGMPDIGRVLASWGQPVIRGKEWRTGNVGVTGGVMVWVLYEPEDGGEPQCMETWLPFQMKWDIPDSQRDGTVEAYPILRGVDARSLSARKLMVRANMGVLAQMWEPGEMTVYSPAELPTDVQVLQNTYPIQIPMEAGEKAFALDDVLSLPSSAPAISKVVRYSLQPVLMEQKVVTDKLVIRGVAMLHILYIGTDGMLHNWDFELPFSQYAELQKEYDPCADARIRFAVTALELDRGEEETWTLKAGITAQYVVFGCETIQLAEDMYSPYRQIDLQTEELQAPMLLDMFTHTMQVESTIDGVHMDPVDVVFYPDQPRVVREGQQVTAELSGVFQILGYDEAGVLQSGVSRWENEWSLDAAPESMVEMTVQTVGQPLSIPGADGAAVRSELALQVQTNGAKGMQMLTGAELGDQERTVEDRPSLILRRAGEESLWEIAKSTGSTVAAIRKFNGIEEEPSSNQMLLIPLS